MPRKRLHDYREDRLDSFGQGMRNAFTLSNTTPAELSDSISVSRQTISQYSNGKAFPSVETLIDIAEYMGVSVDFLLGRANDPSNDASTLALREILPADSETYDYLRTHRSSSTKDLCELLSNQSFRTLMEKRSRLKDLMEYALQHKDAPVPDDPGSNMDYWSLYKMYTSELSECIADVYIFSGVMTEDIREAVLLRDAMDAELASLDNSAPPEDFSNQV